MLHVTQGTGARILGTISVIETARVREAQFGSWENSRAQNQQPSDWSPEPPILYPVVRTARAERGSSVRAPIAGEGCIAPRDGIRRDCKNRSRVRGNRAM